MQRVKQVGLAAVVALLFVTGLNCLPSSVFGVTVDDSDGSLIVGGQSKCVANKWKAGTAACNGGTVLCGMDAIACSTVTVATLVSEIDRRQVRREIASREVDAGRTQDHPQAGNRTF